MDTTSVVSATDFLPVIQAMQDQISVSTVVGVLAVVAGLAVGFVFMWWGVRKGSKALMKSFKSGKFGF